MHAGDLFDHRFTLECALGRGACGEVWSATDARGNRCVIKRLRRAADSELRLRFARELEVARRLGPPHFPELVTGSVSPGGASFIVWRETPGDVLPDWTERVERPFVERARAVWELLRAVGAMHEAGVVHRDLKPEHVLVTQAGPICLLDLGICQVTGSDRLTQSRHFLGSAPFTAPEQILAPHRVDARADLYAVGVIAFWLFSGRVPIWAPNTEALLSLKLLRDAPRLWDACDFDVPDELDAWVATMLERDPERRPANAADALALLERVWSAPATS